MNDFDRQVYYWTHMLDEAFDKNLILEDREGKNINKAEKWIKLNHPEVIGRQLEDGTIITPRILTQEIRNTMPNVRMADCKFLVGTIRLYFENQNNSEIQSMFNGLNKMLKIICTAHVDEYDNDLNGLSFEELSKKFSGAVQKELDSDRDEIDKLVLLKKQDYDIIAVNSFEQAQTYGKYTSWCVTDSEAAFNAYTHNGIGRFYFCLKPGFQNIQKVKGEGCPLDEYGKSMIAVSINDDGSLNTCTCRWNHDNDADDNMMDTKEISEFFGVNFYKTFVPYTADELISKCEAIADGEDEFSVATDTRRCRYPETDEIFYVRAVDGKIEKYIRIADNCVIGNGKFWHLENGSIIEGAPSEVGGDFNCSYTKLTSLKGAPSKIGGYFSCSVNQLTSLEGAPSKVGGDFNCSFNKLTSLEGTPSKVGGNFYCHNNQLTSLEGALSEVSRNFNCSNNQLTSLEGAPSKVGGDFTCANNQLTSLEGAPSEIGRSFYCDSNRLSSLKGAPLYVGGDFYCNNNQLTSLEGAPSKIIGDFDCSGNQLSQKQIDDYNAFLKNPTPDLMDETGHYRPKEDISESRRISIRVNNKKENSKIKKTYTRRQITEAIAYWKKQLKKMNEANEWMFDDNGQVLQLFDPDGDLIEQITVNQNPDDVSQLAVDGKLVNDLTGVIGKWINKYGIVLVSGDTVKDVDEQMSVADGEYTSDNGYTFLIN